MHTPVTPRVIVVDDDVELLNALTLLLDIEGFRCESYASATALLDALRQPTGAGTRPTCIVCDVRMPGMDGLQLLEHLPANNAVSIVFMSGQSGAHEAAHAFRRGAVDFLVKPIDADPLIDAVRRGLAHSMVESTRREHRQQLARRIATLTQREREVARLLATGATNPQMASTMGIAVRTVKMHRRRVMEKLDAGTLADFVRLADTGAL